MNSQLEEQARTIDAFQEEHRKLYSRLLATEQEVTAKDRRIQELNSSIEALLKLKSDMTKIIDEGYSRKYSDLCKAIEEEYDKVTASHRFDPVSAITRLKQMI